MNNQTFRYRLRRLIGAFRLLVGGNFAFAAGYWILNQGRKNPDGSPIIVLGDTERVTTLRAEAAGA